MKQTARKRLQLFPSSPPVGPFGVTGPEKAIHHPNELLRVDIKVTTKGTPAHIAEDIVLRERILRWYTPELYARSGGRYYHKKDKRYYPIVDTKNSNPYRRYVFIKPIARKRKFYTEATRKENKPYNRMVIDLVKPGAFILNASSDNFTLDATNIESAIEVWKDMLRVVDYLDPLQYRDSIVFWTIHDDGSETEEFISKVYVPTSELQSDWASEYLGYTSRIEAFEAWLNGTLFSYKRDDINVESYFDQPYFLPQDRLPIIFDRSGFIPYIASDDITSLYNALDKSLRDHALGGFKAWYGITGPQLVSQNLTELDIIDFDYMPGTILSQLVPYEQLAATLGYMRFKETPLRGTPNLGQFAGELPETVRSFASIFRGLIIICGQLKRLDISGAINTLRTLKPSLSPRVASSLDIAQAAISIDLFYKFGIKPLIEELDAISQLGSIFGDASFFGLNRRSRLDWDKTPWKDEYILIQKTFPFEVSNSGHTISGVSNINLRLRCDSEYGAKIKIKNPYTFFLEATGLNSILGTAWELLPYSFVIDWFIDIGGVISTLTDVDLDSFSIIDSYNTLVLRGDIVETLTINEIDGVSTEAEIENTYRMAKVSRGFFDPRAQVSIDSSIEPALYEQFLALKLLKPLQRGISISKIGTMAELIVQRIRS